MFSERFIQANGIEIHVVEHGEGPAVLFCHGFPETWRSWRRQIEALAAAGYRCIAPDMRGYGGTTAPQDARLYTPLHIVGDLVALLDALGVAEATIVGHDWGAASAWNAALMRPDRFPQVAALSVPYSPRGEMSLLDQVRRSGRDFYMLRFQDQSADAALERDVERTLRNAYYTASGNATDADRWRPFAPMPAIDVSPQATPWLDPADLAHAVQTFERTGFHGALNWYRVIDLAFELMAPFKGARVMQPSLLTAGGSDLVLDFSGPALERLEQTAPGLTGKIILDGIGHWVQQEAPEAVNAALLDFLAEHRR